MVKYIKDTLEDFLSYTTLHGLGRIGAGKHIVQKIIWGVVFLVAASVCSYQVYLLSQQYISEQRVTSIEIDVSPIDFPKITLCNLNPVRFSEVQKSQYLYQVIEKAATESSTSMDNLVQGQLPLYTYVTDIEMTTYPPLSTEWRQLFMTRLNKWNISGMDASLEEFVRSCTFNGVACDFTGDFTKVMEDAYGHCYVYHPNKAVEGTGPQNGLSLVLDVEYEEYIPFISEGMGVVFDIKGKEDTPTPEISGVHVPTGFHTSVALSKRERNFLPGESERCITEPDGFNGRMHCLSECFNHHAVWSCLCSHSVKYGSNLCDNSFYEIVCSINHRWASAVDPYCSHCKEHCRSVEYLPSISMKKWPSVPSQSILQEMFKVKKNISMKKSMLRLDIYFSSITTERVTEEISRYTEESFLSDIGGQLGLWIGMSVLSLAEICELIVLLFTSGLLEKKNNVENT